MKARRLPAASAAGALWPEVNNIPKGLTCIHPEVCSTFMVEGNICWTSGVIETPGQLFFVHLFWIKLHWFMGTCFVQHLNAGFSDQTCNMHPWTLPAASAAGALWPEVNNMPDWTISRRALHVFTLKWTPPQVLGAELFTFWTFLVPLVIAEGIYRSIICNMHLRTWSFQRQFEIQDSSPDHFL